MDAVVQGYMYINLIGKTPKNNRRYIYQNKLRNTLDGINLLFFETWHMHPGSIRRRLGNTWRPSTILLSPLLVEIAPFQILSLQP